MKSKTKTSRQRDSAKAIYPGILYFPISRILFFSSIAQLLHTTCSLASIGCRVNTPYGLGTVDYDIRYDGIVEITLQWGATGFFRIDSVQPIQQQQSAAQRKPKSSNSSNKGSDEYSLVRAVIPLLLNKFGSQTLIGEVLEINRSSLNNWLREKDGASLSATVRDRYISWAEQFDESTMANILDPDFDVSIAWLKQTSLKYSKGHPPPLVRDYGKSLLSTKSLSDQKQKLREPHKRRPNSSIKSSLKQVWETTSSAELLRKQLKSHMKNSGGSQVKLINKKL